MKFQFIKSFSILLLLLGMIISPTTTGAVKNYGSPYSDYNMVNAFPNLDLLYPVTFSYADSSSDYYYVQEFLGNIKVFQKDNPSQSSLFLDLTEKVAIIGEGGNLGLAFHPNFKQNGYFYVFYTTLDQDRPTDIHCNPCFETVISRFQIENNNPLKGNISSELILLNYDQWSDYHVGGNLVFGPDGFLYINVGDSSTSGQNLDDFRGKILRIDVDSQQNGKNYAIPSTNPFFNNSQGYKEEIYAYGFRNPWRGGFDPVKGDYWVGDVGATRYEEINIVKSGQNYGWNITEGEYCNEYLDCNTTGITMPIYSYPHEESDSIDVPIGGAVIGGFVYRGSEFPELYGQYIFADYGGGIFALTFDENDFTVISVKKLFHIEGILSSFSLDENNEIYVVVIYGAVILKLKKIIKADTLSNLLISFSIFIVFMLHVIYITRKPNK